MKLNKTKLLIIGSVVLAIIIAGLGLVYFEQYQEQKQLNARFLRAQVNPAKTEVPKLVAYKADLQTQIDEATSQLETMQAVAYRQIVSSTITKTLFDIAKMHKMEITELVASVPTDTNLDGVNFSLISVNLQAEGDASQMVDFIVDLNSRFSTGVIQSVSIVVPEDATSGNATLEINMNIYTNKGG